jgi:hypothetical protein
MFCSLKTAIRGMKFQNNIEMKAAVKLWLHRFEENNVL